MGNKRFCDLQVGDKLYIYHDDTYFEEKEWLEKEIIDIKKDKKAIWIKTSWSEFVILYHKDECSFITEYNLGYGIQEAISTSMDKLLLETMEG